MSKDIDKEKAENSAFEETPEMKGDETLAEEQEQVDVAEMALNNETSEEESGENEGGELEKLKSEVQEAKDKYLRLYSEFENFRRRTAKERLDLIKMGGPVAE